MAKAFVVAEPFTRKHPKTGEKVAYAKGAMIADAALVADLEASEHEHHLVPVSLPDAATAAEHA